MVQCIFFCEKYSNFPMSRGVAFVRLSNSVVGPCRSHNCLNLQLKVGIMEIPSQAPHGWLVRRLQQESVGTETGQSRDRVCLHRDRDGTELGHSLDIFGTKSEQRWDTDGTKSARVGTERNRAGPRRDRDATETRQRRDKDRTETGQRRGRVGQHWDRDGKETGTVMAGSRQRRNRVSQPRDRVRLWREQSRPALGQSQAMERTESASLGTEQAMERTESASLGSESGRATS